MRTHELFELACKVATSSELPARHGVVIARGKRVISLGINSRKTHPLATKRGRTIHAELAAIIASGSHVRGATLYSARIRSNGTPGKSKPCLHCADLLLAYGIKRVVYHDGVNMIRIFSSELVCL